jgi:hypothetical protein
MEDEGFTLRATYGGRLFTKEQPMEGEGFTLRATYGGRLFTKEQPMEGDCLLKSNLWRATVY